MDLLTITTALTPLIIDWVKERRDGDEKLVADDFNAWMEKIVFPQLLNNSAQMLETIISLKAAEHERFETIQTRLEEIKAAVCSPSPAQRLSRLESGDRALLRYLYEHDLNEDRASNFEIRSLSEALSLSEDEVASAGRMLEEEHHARIFEAAQHWSILLTPEGRLFAWQVLHGGKLEDARKRVGRTLCLAESVWVRELAEQSELPLDIVCAIVLDWENEGQLELRKYDGGKHQWLAFNVSERFKRQYRAA